MITSFVNHFPNRHALTRVLHTVFLCLLLLIPLGSQTPVVSEFRLENGVRVLLAPRPESGAIHASWFIKGGRGDTGNLPSEYADLLLEAWFADSELRDTSGFWTKVSTDGISHGRDIVAEELEAWCVAERNRMGHTVDQREADSAKNTLIQRWRTTDPMASLFALVMRTTNLAVSEQNVESIENFSLKDLQALAAKYVCANRFTVVLIGDISEAVARNLLDASFGNLQPLCSVAPIRPIDDIHDNHSEPLPAKERRFEISSVIGGTHVLIAWPIPPISRNIRPVLNLFTEILVGDQDSGLIGSLVAELGYSENVWARVASLGENIADLFIIMADVRDGHRMADVEQAIHAVLEHLMATEVGYIEINRAVHRTDTKHARRLADASGLAQELILALKSDDDWSRAILRASFDLSLDSEELKSVLQSVFKPDAAYTVFSEQDPIRTPKSPQHARLISLLEQLLIKRGADPRHSEDAIRDTLRQFGLMPTEKRSQLLSMLEAEAAL